MEMKAATVPLISHRVGRKVTPVVRDWGAKSACGHLLLPSSEAAPGEPSFMLDSEPALWYSVYLALAFRTRVCLISVVFFRQRRRWEIKRIAYVRCHIGEKRGCALAFKTHPFTSTCCPWARVVARLCCGVQGHTLRALLSWVEFRPAGRPFCKITGTQL